MKKITLLICSGILTLGFAFPIFAAETQVNPQNKNMPGNTMMGGSNSGMMGQEMMRNQGSSAGMGKGMMNRGASMGPNQEQGMMQNKDPSMGMKMGCPMMMMMMGRLMVATSDGGIVILVGNKLQKYDKDLNLAKETEIKVDMIAMHKMMKEMMEKCPMRSMAKGR